MKKQKVHKTNAVRLLERKKITYELSEFPIGEEHVDAVEVAHLLGVSPSLIYKTLVTIGKNTGPVVAVIPAEAELDLKKLAKVSGNKKIDMLPMKELETTTGYIRGGCSPIGMKKQYPTFVSDTAKNGSEIYVSAGKRGVQIKIHPADLLHATNGAFADIIH